MTSQSSYAVALVSKQAIIAPEIKFMGRAHFVNCWLNNCKFWAFANRSAQTRIKKEVTQAFAERTKYVTLAPISCHCWRLSWCSLGEVKTIGGSLKSKAFINFCMAPTHPWPAKMTASSSEALTAFFMISRDSCLKRKEKNQATSKISNTNRYLALKARLWHR